MLRRLGRAIWRKKGAVGRGRSGIVLRFFSRNCHHVERIRKYGLTLLALPHTPTDCVDGQIPSFSSKYALHQFATTKRETDAVHQMTTKTLQKQSRKASKDETAEKAKLKKVTLLPSRPSPILSIPVRVRSPNLESPRTSLPSFPPSAQSHFPTHPTSQRQALQQGNTEGARIYASNAIRKKNESLNLLRLSSRIDAVASRVETAVTMRQVTGSMTAVVKNMDRAMADMNLEKVSPHPSSLLHPPPTSIDWDR